jgi:hypothetical protein
MVEHAISYQDLMNDPEALDRIVTISGKLTEQEIDEILCDSIDATTVRTIAQNFLMYSGSARKYTTMEAAELAAKRVMAATIKAGFRIEKA